MKLVQKEGSGAHPDQQANNDKWIDFQIERGRFDMKMERWDFILSWVLRGLTYLVLLLLIIFLAWKLPVLLLLIGSDTKSAIITTAGCLIGGIISPLLIRKRRGVNGDGGRNNSIDG